MAGHLFSLPRKPVGLRWSLRQKRTVKARFFPATAVAEETPISPSPQPSGSSSTEPTPSPSGSNDLHDRSSSHPCVGLETRLLPDFIGEKLGQTPTLHDPCAGLGTHLLPDLIGENMGKIPALHSINTDPCVGLETRLLPDLIAMRKRKTYWRVGRRQIGIRWLLVRRRGGKDSDVSRIKAWFFLNVFLPLIVFT